MAEELVKDEHRFTLSEAAKVSGVSEMTLRNWLVRETIKVGQKHRLGRWLFSPSEIVRLRCVGDLMALANIPPAAANEVADLLVKRYFDVMGAPDQKPIRWGRYRIIVWRSGEEIMRAGIFEGEGFPTAKELEDQPWHMNVHLQVPADVMITEVNYKLLMLLVEDEGVPQLASSLDSEPMIDLEGKSAEELLQILDTKMENIKSILARAKVRKESEVE